VAEAKRLGLPIVAVVDTNCNPEGIDFPIPGNDDAIRAINLFAQIIANAVIEAENEVGLEIIETLQDESSEGDFTSYVDKDEISEFEKYKGDEEQKEGVETVAVGAAVGGVAEEQDEAGFTDKDYSDYNPEDEEAKKVPEKTVPVPQVDLADEHNVDEDKLYDE
jgi:small subunit ribosomal protein S2